MEFENEIEVISKLGTISDKLKYYNENVSLLIGIDNFQHQVGFGIGREQHNIFCLCEQCEGKYSISDFEIYRDLRNQETQKIVDFFETTEDYKAKIEYYFRVSQGFSTTTRNLFFVPDILDKINIYEFPYKIYTIDITPKDENQITILKNHLKQKLLKHENSAYLSMAQFTYEKRVEAIQKYLKIRTEKSRRDELIQSEYDKINLSKVDMGSKKPYDRKLLKILKVVEDIIQGKHNEFFYDFSQLEITILAEDVIRYEEYLNSLSDYDIVEKNPQQKELNYEEHNKVVLNQYYDSITNVKIFREVVLKGSDLYYFNRIRTFIDNRNDELLKNKILNIREGWLRPFNLRLQSFLNLTVICLKSVTEWKDHNKDLHENTIHIRLSRDIEFFRQLPYSLRLNYDNNNDFLVLKMREYYINGFQLMLDFLKSELLIDLAKSPFHERINSLVDDIRNAIDMESLKLALTAQNNNKKAIEFNFEDSTNIIYEPNPYPQIFVSVKGYNLFDELHSEFKGSNTILADYSFIYRMMIKENYILDFLKPEMFRSWLCQEPFSIVLDNKLKTLDRCTTVLKQTAYNTIKNKVVSNSK